MVVNRNQWFRLSRLMGLRCIRSTLFHEAFRIMQSGQHAIYGFPFAREPVE